MALSKRPIEPNWPYPVGQPNQAWNDEDRAKWRSLQSPKRSYREEVLNKLDSLKSNPEFTANFEVIQYGSLSQDSERYPLVLIRTRAEHWGEGGAKKNVLITGGVHGYETSGVQGALHFVETELLSGDEDPSNKKRWRSTFNFVVFPCVAPWGYECIQRWTCNAVDVNRSFVEKEEKAPSEGGRGEGRTEESAQLMDWLDAPGSIPNWNGGKGGSRRGAFDLHMDLHETTDSDASEFRPAKAARQGKVFDFANDLHIPQGYYIVGSEDCVDGGSKDAEKPAPMSKVSKPLISKDTRSSFSLAILEAVKKVTPLCKEESILGFPVQDSAAIYVEVFDMAICASLTGAAFAATTEVYPDAEGCSPEECNRAQVAAICGALQFLEKH